jgi:hypothetical protein
MLDDALEATEARDELRIGRAFGPARGPAWWGIDAVGASLDTIGARRPLVTADLATATSDTAPRAGIWG